VKKQPVALIALFVLATSFATRLFAQTEYVTIDSGGYTLKNFNDATALAIGDVVEFGYYNQANATNPFAGTFIALSGGTITNTALTPTSNGFSTTQDTVHTIIGGDTNTGALAGEFVYELVFNQGDANLPANNQIMSMLFFNNTTVASSTDYGAASDPAGFAAWYWTNSTSDLNFQLNYSMGDAGVTWLDNDVAYTGVPEPGTSSLLVGGLIVVALARTRRHYAEAGSLEKAIAASRDEKA
jgi:hypothetical protein